MDDIEPIAGYPTKRIMLEALYAQEGLSIKSIAARVGTSPATIERWMRLLEIPKRSRGGANTPAHYGWRIHRIDPRVVLRVSIRALSRMVQVSEAYCYKVRKGWEVI
jgi:transposase-like protein